MALNNTEKQIDNSHMKFPSYIIKIEEKIKPIEVSLKLVAIYVFIGILWVLISNKLLNHFITNRNMLITISIIKDWIYVLLTSIFLFYLILSTLKKIDSSEKQLIKSYDDLSSAHEELMSLYEELSSTEEELRHNLCHDSLTNLPNKLMLKDELYKLNPKYDNIKIALLYIDLDNFKYINDNFGHTFGDEVIIAISNRLSLSLKEEYKLFRFDGDEFVILAQATDSIKYITDLADKILETVKSPIEIGGNSIVTPLSIGISMYPDNGKNLDELLKKADIALYKAKNEGKGKFVLYDELMNEKLKKRVSIENHLRTALSNKEFVLYYQPQYTTSNGEISGFEALIRWESPELGFISPNDFISIAEDTNLIIPIGKWVLQNACTFIKNINDEFNKDYVISVNISILQLLQNDFMDTVNEALNLADLKPEFLELEITESILMQSFNSISDKLEVLKENGIKIALDDFGKGYSSFSYLKQLPITTLKIDKTFIDTISIDVKSSYIVGLMISLGKKVGLSVVAEGVETIEQFQRLFKYKCNKIQGYFFSRPLPENEIRSLIN